MLFNCRADFCQKRIRKRWKRTDAFVQDDFFDAMNRKEDSIRLNPTFFPMCDVIHPILESVQIDPAHRHSMGCDVHESSEESLSRSLKTDDDDRIKLHVKCLEMQDLSNFNSQNSMLLTSPSTTSWGSVSRCSSSIVTPCRNSFKTSPFFPTSINAISVPIVSPTATPVSGSEHFRRIFGLPSLVACSIATMTRLAPATRSMAPPIPFTIFPGIIQFAMLPCSSTSIAPNTVRSTCPPRIMANESELEKNEAPESAVTVSLPALIRSGSSSPSNGYGPIPSNPFSDCSRTSMPVGM